MEIRFIHGVSTESAEDSLYLPNNMTLECYKPENWRFVELKIPSGATWIYHLMAECKVDGFDHLRYDWKAEEIDFRLYGGGSEEGWKRYVTESFTNTLANCKERMLSQLGVAMTSAFRQV